MAVLYLSAPSRSDRTSFATIVKTGVGPGYGLTEEMAALPSGTRVEVISGNTRSRAVGKLIRVKKTGTKASWRDCYDVFIADLKEHPFVKPPERFDHWGVLLEKCGSEK